MTLDDLRRTLPARLLHRDALMLIIDKPAGVPVHAGPKAADYKDQPPLDAAFDVLRFGLPRDPALAHRLDRDTSGCLILGRHRKALQKLTDLFKAGRIDKTYWAVVEGHPSEEEGTIDLPLGRRDATRGWWMKVDPAGLPSTTRWRVLARSPAGGSGPQLAVLELEPLTGRTHQLRVHCAAMGWPIVGDTVYGHAPREGGPGLHLHARSVSVPLYASRDPIAVAAPSPPHMAERLAACSFADANDAASAALSTTAAAANEQA